MKRTKLAILMLGPVLLVSGCCDIKSSTLPDSIVEDLVNSTIGQTRIHITRGVDASYIDYPENLDIPDEYFTIEDFEHTLYDLYITKSRIIQYPNDINSNNITFLLENATSKYIDGFIRLIIEFEESGTEILGTYSIEVRDMKLTIDLGLEVKDGRVSYYINHVRVNFSFDMDIENIPGEILEWYVDLIVDYEDRLKKAVENKVQSVFNKETTQRAFSDAITGQITRYLGSNPQIISVRIEENQLTIFYCNM